METNTTETLRCLMWTKDNMALGAYCLIKLSVPKVRNMANQTQQETALEAALKSVYNIEASKRG